MSDLDQLRGLTEHIHPPSFESLADTARRRDRRAAGTWAGVAAAVVVVVGAGMVVMGGDGTDPKPVQPSPSLPTPTNTSITPQSKTSMTREEVVTVPWARMYSAGVSPEDTDVRVSLWEAECRWCPRMKDGRGGHLGRPRFTAMALTTDGYATTTYTRSPVAPELGSVTIESPAESLFLFYDTANGREWLVRTDGTIRKIERVDGSVRPSSPRLWFYCVGRDGTDRIGTEDEAGVDYGSWCALDPDTATAYRWPDSWAASAVSPGSGGRPWGWITDPGTWEDPNGGLTAWWDTSAGRRERVLTTDAMGGGVENPPKDDLLYWTWQHKSGSLDLHIGRD